MLKTDGRGKRHETVARAKEGDGGVRQHAVVRLRGIEEIPPETLLAMAEGVRRALRLVGVVDVRIELEADNGGGS